MLASLLSNVISFLCSKDFFDCVGGNLFKGGGTGAQLPPSRYVKKDLILRQTLGHFSTLALTQTFD